TARFGKFSIFYLPHKITIKRNGQQANYLECFIDSLLCYICDSFDFSDQSYQPVGMWDYNEVKFNQYEAMQHLGLYKKHDFIDSLDEMLDIINKGYMMNKYYIINQNYQDYQTHFKFGLDYRIFSKSAKAIEILNNNHLITITLGI
ncbi:DUF6402 family protein, partial [Helicobacter trogontum]|uniref:DUF6402 family protein n=1 Tax=Helicobacter trogontum TaxID=50960 RepID=UPI001F20139F